MNVQKTLAKLGIDSTKYDYRVVNENAYFTTVYLAFDGGVSFNVEIASRDIVA